MTDKYTEVVQKRIIDNLNNSAKIRHSIGITCLNDITNAIFAVVNCFYNNGKLLFCGTGIGATIAQLMMLEYTGKFKILRDVLPCINLSSDTVIVDDLGKEYDLSKVFCRQIEGLAKDNDVLITICSNGNSQNLINAVKTTKKLGLKSISLTGNVGGKIKKLADISIIVPSSNRSFIEDSQITIGHIILEAVELILFSKDE